MLTEPEQRRVLYHLGFPNTEADFMIGFRNVQVILIQQIYVAQFAVQKTTPEAEEKVRSILIRMDDIETRMGTAPDLVEATRISDINPNQDVLVRLDQFYRHWGYRLAETLGVEPYAESRRYHNTGPVKGFQFRAR